MAEVKDGCKVPSKRAGGRGMSDTNSDTNGELARLWIQVQRLKKALGTLITWLPQSANSPIRQDEASELLNILDGHEDW